MKRMASVLRVLLAAALMAPSSAFAQTRIAVTGNAPVLPAVAPTLGSGLAVPGITGAPSIVVPSLNASVVPSAVAPALVPAAVAVKAAPIALTPAAIPLAAVKGEAVPAAAPAVPTAIGALQSMPATLQGAPAAGQKFDGAKAARTPEEPIEPETVTREVSDKEVAEDLALWFTRKDKSAITKSQLSALIRPIYGEPSRRYWEKFAEGKDILIKVAGQGMFMAPVVFAKTAPINRLTRKDFEGVYTKAQMRGKSLDQLRKKIIADLNERNDRGVRGQSGVVTPLSEVRVVRVMPYGEAKTLPINKDETAFTPMARVPYETPAALKGLNHMTTKLVVLDMRLFQDGVPYPLIEDMTKLMKSGIYFALLSDKPAAAVEEQLTRGLSMKQKEMISRYKMVVLSDDGNSLSSYDGAFARWLPTQRFTGQEQELMGFAARQHGLAFETGDRGTRFTARAKKGALTEADRDALVATMRKLGVSVDGWSVSLADGKVTVRPQSLAKAVPYMLEMLRQHEGLYVNHSDIMTISTEADLRGALAGSVESAALLPQTGAELADASLSALLGPARENKPGDLYASASKITSFIHDPNRTGYGGSRGNIYMMMGHVMHSAFNWAVWKYRNEGVFPSAEETVAEAKKIWDREEAEREGNALDRPGEQIAGFYEVMQGRLTTMHAVAADVLKVYPIAVGTELANMLVFDNFKKGVPDNRDILRLIFDFVVARETPEGLEVVIVDFKTGQTPTLQNLEKDVQVQLYDTAVRKMWPQLSLPYGPTGESKKVADYKIRFIYPSAGYQPMLNEWTRIKFERFLRNVMNRIRRHNAPPAPKADAKKPAKKKPAAKKPAAKKA